ncbi:hypothetical protein T01_7266 [Trichinella spiralis]|uniref:Uncharacterized protein n=1 Tax=Trichinella spiralis TaxID=6334 RepID=A0A0V1BW19_TRISP|nr:hypothetical protein T01_7266 [Trichinella spiralis]
MSPLLTKGLFYNIVNSTNWSLLSGNIFCYYLKVKKRKHRVNFLLPEKREGRWRKFNCVFESDYNMPLCEDGFSTSFLPVFEINIEFSALISSRRLVRLR